MLPYISDRFLKAFICIKIPRVLFFKTNLQSLFRTPRTDSRSSSLGIQRVPENVERFPAELPEGDRK
jgi:hypothetical protein